MAILVTGGAGYIGSHAVKALLTEGYDVVVFDNLSTGFRAAVQSWAGREPEFIQGDIGDTQQVISVLQSHDIQAVMHFAANSLVAESMQNPAKYYTNNVAGTISLLEAIRATKLVPMIFSSTSAIYGTPEHLPIDENTPKHPENVYGRTKWMLEQVLQDYSMAYGLRSICLRYFNAAGADDSGRIGEAHNPESHLIPNLIKSALGQQGEFKLYGTDYPTQDGTCVRDYIHITDLIAAHLLALKALLNGAGTTAYNLGNGNGFSNLQVLRAVEGVVGQTLTVSECPRRPGDPATLVATSARVELELGWKPQFPDIEVMARSAYQWHQSHPRGYAE